MLAGNRASQEANASFPLVLPTSFWPAPTANQAEAQIQYNAVFFL